MEKGNVTALTLLDLSAAFDTIDHGILLRRLRDWFGIEGVALNWIVSYLTNRSQSINLTGSLSIHFHFLVSLRAVYLDHYFLFFTPLHSVQLSIKPRI